MNYDTWAATFKPVDNHLNTNAAYDGKMFETYGDEYEFLKTVVDVHRIWTIRDEDGGSYLTAGMGWVNRMGYLVTEEPWVDGGLEYVQLSESVECECYKEEGYGPFTFPNGYEYYENGDPECKECEGNGTIEKWLD